jgi:hypothetical protein
MCIGYGAAIANDLDRNEEAGLQVCWAHHWLCLGAGANPHFPRWVAIPAGLAIELAAG